MKRPNQSGAAIIETLLVILIAGLVGFVGWYVRHSQQVTAKALDAAATSQTITPKNSATTTVGSTDGWNNYSSKVGAFMVKYPKDWIGPSHPEFCGDFLDYDLEIGPDAKSVIKCGGDGTVSQVSITSVAGDKRSDYLYNFDKTLYDVEPTTKITLSGITGNEFNATAHNQSSYPAEGLGIFPDGTKIIEDVFLEAGRTYVIRYTQEPAGSAQASTDQLATFKLIRGTFSFQ